MVSSAFLNWGGGDILCYTEEFDKQVSWSFNYFFLFDYFQSSSATQQGKSSSYSWGTPTSPLYMKLRRGSRRGIRRTDSISASICLDPSAQGAVKQNPYLSLKMGEVSSSYIGDLSCPDLLMRCRKRQEEEQLPLYLRVQWGRQIYEEGGHGEQWQGPGRREP